MLCENGVFLPLSTFQDTHPLLRALLRTSVPTKTLTRHPLRTFLMKDASSKEPCKNPSSSGRNIQGHFRSIFIDVSLLLAEKSLSAFTGNVVNLSQL